MGITDFDIVDLIQLSYQPDSQWDLRWSASTSDNLTVCVKKLDGTTAIIFPGTTDIQGWLRDFEAIDATPHDHPQLGPVHIGFWAGVSDAYDAVAHFGYLNDPIIVGGHSKGAAAAILFAGLLTANGKPPLSVVTCGEPRAGMAPLVELLKPVPICSYRNGDDPVWGVPFHVDVLFPYDHPRAPICIDAPPPPGDPWELSFPGMGWHHIELYVKGVAALDPEPGMAA